MPRSKRNKVGELDIFVLHFFLLNWSISEYFIFFDRSLVDKDFF